MHTMVRVRRCRPVRGDRHAQTSHRVLTPPDEEVVNELGRSTAHAALANWMAGDHDTLNNPFRGRDF